ncbi:sugar phosphate isomerase/epimerase [Pasteurella canis]|uniref:Xylose isomerase-like TIM barrel domain-containing protein n=2 Tax=Pasteurella canis TaxID=753 RepID=A0ABQ4VI90_9PAST|nr:sugar phosphate isomerase/epimerase [Pasteurella canis]MXN89222.1 TIM barrel protein [Pasteurella canis]UAX41531.1 sugar phosphate isomerase/epimerase [Pasteurella canis]UAY78718.1 sugar phosphate isomerase/epimerase [Pasteurella canis]UDW83088.1 sugar phosphate isomerase/epimerase [Pasteurella canis]UEC22612.1 sugar phosphate isomerase/epimerase [Pasteurella canis]
MNNKIKLAVNTSIYDGYDLDVAFSSIKKCGFDFFELAYNQGYVSNLNDSLFTIENANYINSLKEKYKLDTLALGCTMDLSTEGLYSIFLPRLRFANLIGVKYINVCTTKLMNKEKLIENLISLKPLLDEFDCILCLENAGDYNFNAFTTLDDGIALLNILGFERYALNFDPGNMATYQPDLDILSQAIKSIDYCRYFHIKDVACKDDKFNFVTIGEGSINYLPIINEIMKENIPCSLEIPLRIYRELDSTPVKKEERVSLDLIENVLIKSREYIDNAIKGTDLK